MGKWLSAETSMKDMAGLRATAGSALYIAHQRNASRVRMRSTNKIRLLYNTTNYVMYVNSLDDIILLLGKHDKNKDS